MLRLATKTQLVNLMTYLMNKNEVKLKLSRIPGEIDHLLKNNEEAREKLFDDTTIDQKYKNFQDPYGSLNPRMTIGNIISEPLEIYKKENDKKSKTLKVLDVMEKVGLSDLLFNRFPHELSGGQCQRVGIARSIINEPDVLICDEPVSSLDLSVQSQILDLLKSLKNKLNITMIFVSHDLAVVKSISDEVMVLKQGEIVEKSSAEQVFNNPKDEYTKKLISSVPRINNIE